MFTKICGITSESDAEFVVQAGADAIGLMLAKSTRRILVERAREIAAVIPSEIMTVGVFRNEAKERVVELSESIGFDAVQLHGQESRDETRWIGERVPLVIKAFTSSDPELSFHQEYGDIQLLIDSPEPGSGKTFDWNELAGLKVDRPYILAGGLSPDNVESAISLLSPWGVDVSSGVEESPGKKDRSKVERFIAAAKQC